ncbi:MAG: zinc ribbon domain-containing protein [Oscillospiraceae bacterium]|nr:zinc ribbon domain-containing protein [Oscillospiraceae bacterium]
MKTCNNCGAQVEDVAKFCPECGFKFGSIAEPRAVVTDMYDHTSEFSPEDIANNKLYAILMYCVSLMGIIIGLLAAGDSPYVRFHIKQSLKLFICEVILGLITGALFWTVIVGIVGGIAIVVLAVVDIICLVNACKGLAKEPPIVCKIGFLK